MTLDWQQDLKLYVPEVLKRIADVYHGMEPVASLEVLLAPVREMRSQEFDLQAACSILTDVLYKKSTKQMLEEKLASRLMLLRLRCIEGLDCVLIPLHADSRQVRVAKTESSMQRMDLLLRSVVALLQQDIEDVSISEIEQQRLQRLDAVLRHILEREA